MEYQWDDEKRDSNVEKHGFDFVDAWMILERDHVLAQAKIKDKEVRFRATGFIHGVQATAIYTMREHAVRLISVRRASANERRQYQALFK